MRARGVADRALLPDVRVERPANAQGRLAAPLVVTFVGSSTFSAPHFFFCNNAAWAAANLAIGTRNGEQET